MQDRTRRALAVVGQWAANVVAWCLAAMAGGAAAAAVMFLLGWWVLG